MGVEFRPLKQRLAIALSGGGFRASLFHLGVLRRAAELGWLPRVTAISGVSGGGILAAFAALRWDRLIADGGDAAALQRHVTDPFVEAISARDTARDWVARLPAGLFRKMIEPSFTRTDVLGSLLGERLYDGRLCTDFPDAPLVVLNATSLVSVRAWRFTKHGLGDSRIGYSTWQGHPVAVGHAVAASAAFPPVFAPARIRSSPYQFRDPLHGEPAIKPPKWIPLTDGGVYENMATEALAKRTGLPGGVVVEPAEFLLVSDGGYPTPLRFEPSHVPLLASLSLLKRANTIAMAQVSALRRRSLVHRFDDDRDQSGLLVVLGSSLDRLKPEIATAYRACVGADRCPPPEIVARLHAMRTHLNRFSPAEADALMYFAYMLTDAFLWSRGDALPEAYRRPPGPPPWQIVFDRERTAQTLAALARSHRLF